MNGTYKMVGGWEEVGGGGGGWETKRKAKDTVRTHRTAVCV